MDEMTAEYAVGRPLTPAELRARAVVSVVPKRLGRIRENKKISLNVYVSDDTPISPRAGKYLWCATAEKKWHAAGRSTRSFRPNLIDVYLNHPAADVSRALTEALQAANRYVFLVAKSVPSDAAWHDLYRNGAAAEHGLRGCRWRLAGVSLRTAS